MRKIIKSNMPTPLEQNILNTWPFNLSRKLNRFANRLENFTSNKVCQSRKSEILSSFSGLLSKLGFNRDELNVKAFRMYGKKSEKVLINAAKEVVMIYHYRAWFGQSSVSILKSWE